jgi:hypothetical protein
MWLRLLVPLTLIWPILALAAEGTSLRYYKGTAARELLALTFSIIAYGLLWFALHRVGLSLTGSEAAAIAAASLLSLLAVPVLLFLGYKVFGVKAEAGSAAH